MSREDHEGTEKAEKEELREVTDVIGGFGRWQAYVIVIMAFSKMIGCYHNFATTFTAPKVDHWCSRPPSWANVTLDRWRNITDGRCKRYVIDEDNGDLSSFSVDRNHTIPCTSWEYDTSVFSYTLTEKFNLVCSQSWLVSLDRSIYMAGFLMACLVMGPMADRFGRRPILLVCGILLFVAASVNAFSPNYIVFVIFRFLVAFGRVGVLNASFVLGSEVVGSKYRPPFAVFNGMSFVLGYITLPGIAYLTRNWFHFQLAITVPTLPLAIVLWTIPESPRWLLLKGKTEEAKKTIVSIAKMNRIEVKNPDHAVQTLMNALKENTGKVEKANVIGLMRTPNMRKKTLIMYFAWCVTAFVFYGLSFNVGDIGGNLFSSFALFGVAQLPAHFVCYFTLTYLGRRTTLAGSLGLAGIACLAIIPLGKDLVWLRVSLATIGMSFISAAFSVVYLYSSEIFPTKIRSLGVTSCSICARIGSIIAPFMKELGEGNNFMVPMGLFGCLAILAGLLVLLLPDTTGCPLPETLEQGELFGKKQKKTKDVPLQNVGDSIGISSNVKS